MTSLFWAVQWDFGVYTLNEPTKQLIVEAIRQRVEGHQISVDDIGKYLSNVPIIVNSTPTGFTARLERIDPTVTFAVDANTDIEFRLVTDIEAAMAPHMSGGLSGGPSLVKDLEDMVMFQTTFDPGIPDSHYMQIYESLVGIPKELILHEMLTLLLPPDAKEKWSRRHYGNLVPALVAIANKAPVIVIGGDPGTGKTALATSIGAPLAKALGEKVHFRHMSLMLRGMGYQGRASGMIVKLFEYIKREYIQLREPFILFFDEAEAVVGSRGETDSSSGAQENIAVVDAIIVGVDGLRKGLQARVVALFATNLTNRVDSALMRRSYYYAFDRPDDGARRELFKNSLNGMDFDSPAFDQLVAATNPRTINGREVRFTPSDIVELIIGRAVNQAVRQDKPVSLELLLDYCSKTTPTF